MAGWRDKDKGKVGVHLLVITFGITSWSIMNGLWVELPILVPHLPEGWTLPSYLTIVSQFGNLGPVLFSVASCMLPHKKLETGASVLVVTALTLCALFFGLFWKETAVVADQERSIALLTLTFGQAMFAATTSITYLAFMAHLQARYMSSIFIGMGLSGLIPAFAAIGQGSGNVRCLATENTTRSTFNLTENGLSTHLTTDSNLHKVEEEPAFTVQTFFLLLSAVGVLSFLSLLMLIYHPYCQTEHIDTDSEENCKLMDGQKHHKKLKEIESTTQQHKSGDPNMSTRTKDHSLQGDSKGGQYSQINENSDISKVMSLTTENPNGSQFSPTSAHSKSHDVLPLFFYSEFEKEKPFTNNDDCNTARNGNFSDAEKSQRHGVEEESDLQDAQIGKWESWYLLGLLVWINILQTSYVLAIQVYSSLPYGLYFYNGVTKAENIVDPVACLACLFVSARTSRTISGLTLLGTLFTTYIIVVAAMSPHPFLEGDNSTMGGVLVLVAWVMCTVFMVFSKVSIAGVMRTQGRTSLIWTGASTQIGAFIGAVLAYVMINHMKLFKDGAWC